MALRRDLAKVEASEHNPNRSFKVSNCWNAIKGTDRHDENILHLEIEQEQQRQEPPERWGNGSVCLQKKRRVNDDQWTISKEDGHGGRDKNCFRVASSILRAALLTPCTISFRKR